MSQVRTKFKCMQVAKDEYGETVALRVVNMPTEENKSIAEATPAGEIQMRIDKKAGAYGQFEAGDEYFVDFIPAPATARPEPTLVIEEESYGNGPEMTA